MRPALFVLAAPGIKPAPGSVSYRCMGCTNMFPMARSTLSTVAALREQQKPFMVVCHGCYQEMLGEDPPAFRQGPVTGVAEARRQLGLDKPQ